jgi:hypothetical protein
VAELKWPEAQQRQPWPVINFRGFCQRGILA